MTKQDARVMLVATKGKWWRYARTLKRNPYIGYVEAIQPVLSPCHPCADPVSLLAPTLPVIDGVDYEALACIEIEPVVRKGQLILEGLGKDRIRPSRDFAAIMADIRDAVAKLEGGEDEAYAGK